MPQWQDIPMRLVSFWAQSVIWPLAWRGLGFVSWPLAWSHYLAFGLVSFSDTSVALSGLWLGFIIWHLAWSHYLAFGLVSFSEEGCQAYQRQIVTRSSLIGFFPPCMPYRIDPVVLRRRGSCKLLHTQCRVGWVAVLLAWC